jgi:hypothetical protein
MNNTILYPPRTQRVIRCVNALMHDEKGGKGLPFIKIYVSHAEPRYLPPCPIRHRHVEGRPALAHLHILPASMPEIVARYCFLDDGRVHYECRFPKAVPFLDPQSRTLTHDEEALEHVRTLAIRACDLQAAITLARIETLTNVRP